MVNMYYYIMETPLVCWLAVYFCSIHNPLFMSTTFENNEMAKLCSLSTFLKHILYQRNISKKKAHPSSA